MRQRNNTIRVIFKGFMVMLLCVLFLLISVYGQAQEVQAWGDNQYHQNDVPSDLAGIQEISSGLGHTMALKHDGTVTVWGWIVPGNAVTDVKSISAGTQHAVVLKSDGTVVAWGSNSQGQLNIPSGLANVKAVSAGYSHTLALKSDGTVVAWGSNSFNQSTVPSSLSDVIAVSAGLVHSLALKADGTVVSWGGIASPPSGLSNVIAISAGFSHAMALKSDGTVVCWGNNANGQTTIPPGLTNVIAVSAGGDHSVALKADGTVVAWGRNEYGQVSVPIGLTGVVEIEAGAANTVVRKAGQTRITVWGSSFSTLSPPSFDISGIKSVAAGRTAGLALNPDGTVTAWGTGTIVTALPTDLTNVKAVAAGVGHALALKADGTVVAWGSNSSFGEGDVPVGLTGVKAIAVGAYHNVAVKSDGTVVYWGNDAAEAGFPSSLSMAVAVAAGSVHNVALLANGTVSAWGNNSDGQITVPGDATNVIDISGGNQHTLALKADGKVVGWGLNTNDQYNFPSSLADVKSVAAGQGHSLVLLSDGTLNTTGINGISASTIPAGLNAALTIDSRLNNNVAMVMDQPPVLAGIATGMNYLEGASAQVLQGSLTITDNSHTSFSGATISISSGFVSGDQLAVTTSGGVTQAYDAAIGILTLAGTATVAEYQTMLRSLTYRSTSAAPALNAVRTINISVSDGTQSGDASFTLNVVAVNDAPSFNVIGSLVAAEDVAGVSVNALSGMSPGPADEAGQVLTVEVENNNNDLFSVQPAISSSGRLTFTLAPDAHGTATLTVRVKDDGGTLNGGVDQLEKTLPILVNAVNDAPSFTKGADVEVHEDTGTQTILAWATDMSPGPANEAAQTLSFSVSNAHTDLFASQPALDVTGNLTFTSAPDKYGVAIVTVRLFDNGGTVFGGVNNVIRTFTITIHPVNDAPSFTPGNDVESLEDGGSQTVSGWATLITAGSEEEDQLLLFIVDNDNNDLFSVQPFINASGNLSFTLAPDAAGSANVTVVLQDDGGTANGGVNENTPQSFGITIHPVNDVPIFTKGNDIVVNEDSPAQSINAWATGISPGPGEETQTLHFNVSNDNPGLFSVQPFVDASGNLTFTPSPGVVGAATVTLSLQDNGGTANGGVDESIAETFLITIDEVNDAPSFVKGPDIILNEDAVPYSAAWATAISAGEPGQTLSFVVSADNPDLFAVQPFVSATGVLSFSVQQNAFGSSLITVYLNDDGGIAQGGIDRSVEETFTITVHPVNDAPSIDPVSDLTITVNSKPVVINLSGIHPGIQEEEQQLTIEAFSENESVIPQPQLTPVENGAVLLTFTPVSNASGTSTMTIRIRDDGGVETDGEDETIISFTITVEEEAQAIFLPNFFSPNSNGMNDAFKVRGAGIEQIQFRIYNMEGQELFSTTDVTAATESGWDGKYKGKDQPAGTYIWTLQGIYINGQPLTNDKTKYGQVILMR